MAQLVVSILSKDKDEVYEKLSLLEQIPELENVQLDFADGLFAPNELVYPKALGHLKTRLTIEAHLMVQKPQDFFNDLEMVGAKTVFVHYESFSDHAKARSALRNARFLGFSAGLAINPSTDVSVCDWLASDCDEFLIMGVTPGFQGQKFRPETLQKISTLRDKYKNAIIEVDGGLKLSNVERVIGAGADKVNVGSGIWHNVDQKKAVHEFLEKIKNKNDRARHPRTKN